MGYDVATPYTASYLLLKKDGKIAMIMRANTSWMNDHWGIPAGKVEKGESYTACAIREAKEEAGVTIEPKDLKFVHVCHRSEGYDWVDVFFEVTDWQGEAHNAEPHMHSQLEWFELKNLPGDTIPSLRYCLEQIADGKLFSEYGWSQ